MITRRGWIAGAGLAAAAALLSKQSLSIAARGNGDRALTEASAQDELRARAWSGLATRIRGRRGDRRYARRLRRELAALTSNAATVQKLLVLSDLVRWARWDGIPVGPGWGTAPNSLVCWALGITGVDPLRYDLVFERFFSSAKQPYVDLHVCALRRDGLLDQLVANEAEAQVVVLRRPTSDVDVFVCAAPWRLFSEFVWDRIAQLVRELRACDAPPPRVVAARDPALAAAYDGCCEVRDWCEDVATSRDDPTLWPRARRILVSARTLPTNGSQRSWPVVAASAYEPSDDIVEFDLTGRKILTVLGVSSDAEPVTDAALWRFFATGAHEDVYELEEVELRRFLQLVEPESIEGVAATISLYRPGPIEAGWIEELAAARKGRRRIDPMHPAVAAILAPTRGLLVYQEQLIRIVAEVSGLSLVDSNQVRRDLAARRAALIEGHREAFVAGARKRGCTTETAKAIFARFEGDPGFMSCRAQAIAEATLTLRSARQVLHARLPFAASRLPGHRVT